MSDAIVSVLATCGGLVVLGSLVGLIDRRKFSFAWLLVAALLFFVNDSALTRIYGLLPEYLGDEWNWTGKLLALAITLAIASHPAFGWERSGLTLKQKTGSLAPALAVSAVLVALFTWLALSNEDGGASAETLAFQLSLPGLEEEPFYRGILLLALNEAFRARFRALGIEWGWGGLLSLVLFGLAHGFGYEDGSFWFDPIIFAMTAGPSLILVWLRERTGSLLLPVLLHNFGNSIGHFI